MSALDSYRIKRIRFFTRQVPILCQNENGPCPLLAIGNVLLLQGNISIHPDLSEIKFSELAQLMAGFLLDSNPPHQDSRINANLQKQLDAVIKLLPRLQYGLDVNVRFGSVRGFEFTEEMAAFDMSGTTLLHGWIVDPEDRNTAAVIESLSYNKLVEMLLDFRSLTAEMIPSNQRTTSEGCPAIKETAMRGGRSSGSPMVVEAKQDATCLEQSIEVVEGEVAGQASKMTSEAKADVTRLGGHPDSFNVLEAAGPGSTQELATDSDGTHPTQHSECIGNHDPVEGNEVAADGNGDSNAESTTMPIAPTGSPTLAGGARPALSPSAQANRPHYAGRGHAFESNTASAEVLRTLKGGHTAEEFFRETASQLTYFGLSQLHQEVRERQLCVFFRNNHFSTLFKFQGKLYLLVTDLGVVWEKLDQIDGDTEYVNSDFARSSRRGSPSADSSTMLMASEFENQDYMLALALQEEDSSALASASGPRGAVSAHQPAPAGDEAVALALQQEERNWLQQQRIAEHGDQVDFPLEAAGRRAAPDRRVPRERERRRPTEAGRGTRSETGSGCSIQ